MFNLMRDELGRHAETVGGIVGKAIQDSVAEKNAAYRERDMVLSLVCKMGLALGWQVWRGKDLEQEEGWQHVVFVELPGGGQASWHVADTELEWFVGLPLGHKRWDGHTTEEKYERILSWTL